MSVLQNLTPLAVVPQNDRLQRFSIVSINEKLSPGTGKLVIAQFIRQEEVAHRIVACVNACAGIPTECLEFGPDAVNPASILQQRDHFQQLAEHRGRSIDNLLNTQGRMSTLNDQLLAALENAHKLILSFREEEVSYFEKGTGFYDHEKELAAHDAEYNAAIAAAKGGAV